MLCNVCSSIDFPGMLAWDQRLASNKLFSRTKTVFHHSSYTALLNAARNGCQLCQTIDEERRAEEAKFNRPIQDMEAIEKSWSWLKRTVKGQPGMIACQFQARRSVVAFRRFYASKNADAGTQIQNDGRFEVRLRIFTQEDSPGAKLGLPGRPIEIDPISAAAIRQTQNWMASCAIDHRGSCQTDTEHILPTRVIDVNGGKSNEPFLHISNGQQGRWLVLSHVWGREVKFVTEAGNLEDMKASIPLQELPATFRDAIILTRKLGFQYVWIDSLCIIQDQKEDWAAELVHMHEYYQNSSLMIAVDDAEGDQVGFLQPRPTLHQLIEVPFNPEKKEKTTSLFFQRQPPDGKNPCPLQTRGWTLQEDVLSPRAIHFQTSQTTWECQTDKYEELKPWKERSRKQELLGSSPDSWFRVVGEFSNRNLTFQYDKLPALSAVAKESQRRNQWTYKAGLWLEDMHNCLVWNSRDPGVRSRAPSWSWASLDIPWQPRSPFSHVDTISFFERWHPGVNLGPVSEIIDCQVVTQDGDPFGRVESGVLRIRGPWKKASEWTGFEPFINPQDGGMRKDFSLQSNPDPRLKYAPIDRRPDDLTQLVCTFDEEIASPKTYLQKLSLIQILKRRFHEEDIAIGLILEAVEEAEGTFRRRGIAQIPVASTHAELGWETREVAII